MLRDDSFNKHVYTPNLFLSLSFLFDARVYAIAIAHMRAGFFITLPAGLRCFVLARGCIASRTFMLWHAGHVKSLKYDIVGYIASDGTRTRNLHLIRVAL